MNPRKAVSTLKSSFFQSSSPIYSKYLFLPMLAINVGSGKPYSVVGMPHKLLEQPSQELINELDKESRPKYPDHDNSQQSTQMLENGEVSLEDRSHVLNVLGKMCRDLKTIPDSTHIEDCFGLANERHGGSASVSHGIYRGRKVAVKSVHLYITSDYDERFGVCIKFLCDGAFT